MAPHEPPQALVEALDEVVGDAIQRHSERDEVFISCRACGGFEEHTDDCPIPWIDHWLANGNPEAAHVVAHVRHVQAILDRWRAS